MIQATVAVYPLGQPDNTAIDRALEALQGGGAQLTVRNMNSELLGEEDAVFAALRAAFDAAAETGGVVMTVTVSNACPVS